MLHKRFMIHLLQSCVIMVQFIYNTNLCDFDQETNTFKEKKCLFKQNVSNMMVFLHLYIFTNDIFFWCLYH